MSTIRRHVIAPLSEGRTYRRLGFLVSAIPLGIAWLVILITGWSLGLGLAITLIGIPVLLALAYAAQAFAGVERELAGALLDRRIPPPARRPWRGGPVNRLRTWISDPVRWREQAYLVVRGLLGAPLGVAVAALVSSGLQLIAAPFYFWTLEVDLGFWTVDTLGEALLVVPVGVLLVLLSVPAVNGAAVAWQSAVVPLLAEPRSAGASAGREAASMRGRRRGLVAHAIVYAALNLGLIVIWLATTPGEYFWPRWTLAPLGLLLGIHALIALRPRPGTGRAGSRWALEIHAGLAGLVALFLVVVWALTTPGGFFWPVWTIVGLMIPVAIHVARVATRGDDDREEMAERIDVLTTTRAGAVDAQAAELRRIERDLHDGAQARLVALAMDLGIAREKMSTEPAAAEALVTEAHQEAKRALVELRDLARGIHPAVLTDRGLSAAIATLAGRSPVPVELDVRVEERLPAAIEAASYFVVAEALTNVAKHSEADVARVRVDRQADRLTIDVADDGRGGADPEGGGLDGLRSRVEALDGRMAVHSPPGSGTLVRVELPCA